MEKLKKLIHKKYFALIAFSVMLALFALLLILTIQHDAEAAAPQDNMLRTEGTVTYINTYTVENENGSMSVHHDVRLHVETEDGKVYDDIFLYDVPSVDVGSTIKLKYDKNTTGIFLIANEEPPHFRVFLYILYSAFILFAVGGIIGSVRILQKNKQQKVIEQNLENRQQPAQTDSHGIDYNSTDAYQGYDGTETDMNPFAGSDMDYTSMYEYEQNLQDAEYSAAETYTGYTAPEPSHHPMDAAYSATGTYTGYTEPADTPADTSYSAPAPAGAGTPAPAAADSTPGAPAPDKTAPASPSPTGPMGDYPPMNAPYPPGMYMGYPPMNAPYSPGMYMGYGGPGYPPMNTPYPPGMYMGYGGPGFPPMNMPYPAPPPAPGATANEAGEEPAGKDSSSQE